MGEMRMNFLSAAKHSSNVVLSSEQIQSFRKNGFLTIDSISLPEEVATIRRIFDRLIKNKTGFAEGALFDLLSAEESNESPKLLEVMNPLNYAAELRHTLFRANALAI